MWRAARFPQSPDLQIAKSPNRQPTDTRTLVTTLEAALESHLTILQLTLAQEQAAYLATHDPLTNLSNRPAFKERLAQAIASARRT